MNILLLLLKKSYVQLLIAFYQILDINRENRDQMPLLGVPRVLTPDILHALSSMGHGDEIVLADVHFPASSTAKASNCGTIELRADACQSLPHLLESVLKFFPLDEYDSPVRRLIEKKL